MFWRRQETVRVGGGKGKKEGRDGRSVDRICHLIPRPTASLLHCGGPGLKSVFLCRRVSNGQTLGQSDLSLKCFFSFFGCGCHTCSVERSRPPNSAPYVPPSPDRHKGKEEDPIFEWSEDKGKVASSPPLSSPQI